MGALAPHLGLELKTGYRSLHDSVGPRFEFIPAGSAFIHPAQRTLVGRHRIFPDEAGYELIYSPDYILKTFAQLDRPRTPLLRERDGVADRSFRGKRNVLFADGRVVLK